MSFYLYSLHFICHVQLNDLPVQLLHLALFLGTLGLPFVLEVFVVFLRFHFLIQDLEGRFKSFVFNSEISFVQGSFAT